MLNAVVNGDGVGLLSESSRDGHVVGRHIKGVHAIARKSGGNSVLSAAFNPGGLQRFKLIALGGSHCQYHGLLIAGFVFVACHGTVHDVG